MFTSKILWEFCRIEPSTSVNPYLHDQIPQDQNYFDLARSVFPNHCSGDHSCYLSIHQVFPETIKSKLKVGLFFKIVDANSLDRIKMTKFG